jgi:hypothetical protein
VPSTDDEVGVVGQVGVVGEVGGGGGGGVGSAEAPDALGSVPLASPVAGATEISPEEISPEESAPEAPGHLAGPRLMVPFRSEAPRAPLWLALVAGLVTGVVAGVIASPVAGVAVGVATGVVLLVPALRAVLGLLAVAGVVAAGVYVAVRQGQDHVPAGGNWPLSFNSASKLAWAGVVFLGADGAVEIIQRGSSALRRRAPGGSGAPEGSDAEVVSDPDSLLADAAGDGPEVVPGA